VPPGVATRIVAVDGHGGAGKSTFADRLAAALGGVPVAHTDDFASWEEPVDWWPRCIRDLLEPLAHGETARYPVSAWAGKERPPVEIPPAEIVILEGVTASREAFRPYLAHTVWVETPRELCLQRGLERDGEEMRADWERWLESEDAYIARERPELHADTVVLGF
jgi:uridine kinase